jgi:HEXXH motif-containing protein
MMKYAANIASPLGGDTTGLIQGLGRQRLLCTQRRIIGALTDAGHDASLLAAFLLGFNTAWRPEAGLALLFLREGNVGCAGLQVALAIASTGSRGAVSLPASTPTWLFLDGWLVRVAGNCSITSHDETLVISSELACTRFNWRENRWMPDKSQSGPWFAYDGGSLAPTYVTASRLRHGTEGFPWIKEAPAVAAATFDTAIDQRIGAIRQGWHAIVSGAPDYADWVASTARGCLLLDPSGTHEAQSGSSFDHPGLIAIEPPDCPLYCGELLVHECSHQHMLAYTMVAPMTEAGSQETYYSPIKRAERTIDRVLTGAHAVGNMIIYYEMMQANRELDDASAARLRQHREWFKDDYIPAMASSKTLTEAGRALWHALREAVNASRSGVAV